MRFLRLIQGRSKRTVTEKRRNNEKLSIKVNSPFLPGSVVKFPLLDLCKPGRLSEISIAPKVGWGLGQLDPDDRNYVLETISIDPGYCWYGVTVYPGS